MTSQALALSWLVGGVIGWSLGASLGALYLLTMYLRNRTGRNHARRTV
jgi:hypothetical protein